MRGFRVSLVPSLLAYPGKCVPPGHPDIRTFGPPDDQVYVVVFPFLLWIDTNKPNLQPMKKHNRVGKYFLPSVTVMPEEDEVPATLWQSARNSAKSTASQAGAAVWDVRHAVSKV